MENDRLEEERDLKRLTEDLERLQIQINKVNQQISEIRSKQNKKEPVISNKKKTTLKVGDTVIVTGTYKNRKGVTGTVVKITPAQIRLKPENGKDEFQVYKQNVKLA
jgi:preprotein translocase subunit YajC